MMGGDCRRSCCHRRRCHDGTDIVFVHYVVRQVQSRKHVPESSAGGPPRRIIRSSLHRLWAVALRLPVLVLLMLMMIFFTKNDCLLSSICISTVRGFVPNTSNRRIIISTRGHMDAPAGRIRGQYRSSSMSTMIDNSVQPTEEEDNKVQSKSKKRKTRTTKIARKSKSKSTKSKKRTVTSTTTTKDSAAGQKKKNDLYYWSDESDPVMIIKKNADGSNHHQVSKLRFKVRGNPRPLQRHRTSRGFMYNPSLKYQTSFERVVVDDLLVDRDDTSDDDTFVESSDRIRRPSSSSLASYPVFGPDEYLAMTLVFKMKRPMSHFINNRPGPGRLKPTAPGMMSSTIRTDIDNLVKFVLDSMNNVLYEDDRQVTSIQATKVFDNDDTCDGSIELCIHKIDNDGEMDEIIRSMVQ